MDLQIVYLEPAKMILSRIGDIFIKIAVVLIVLLIGWIIAKAIKSLVIKLLKTVKIDDVSQKINLNALLLKGGINVSVSDLIGVLCYWIIMLVTLFVGMNTAGLNQAAELLEKVILYIPNTIAAIFVLLLGMFAATILSNIVKTASANAGVEQGPLFGKIIQIAVVVFATAIALEQLNIATLTIHSTISIIIGTVLGSIGLGFALAFGLGCKDLVGKLVAEFLEKIKSKK
ncbi:MAG: hypothetical protein WCY05_00795 [Candidatus Omnitrophota bacterium]